MQLTEEFDVSVPVEQGGRQLTDLERAGSCLLARPSPARTGRTTSVRR